MSTQPPNESSHSEPAHTRPAVSSAGGRFKTADEMLEPGEQSQSTTGYKAPVFFAVGFALLLFGSIFLIDHSGPTTEVAARITGKDVRDPRRRADDYFLQGVDVDGGEFDTEVSKSNYDLVRTGDEVVISRAWLTERVIGIDGPGYDIRKGGGAVWPIWVAIAVALAILLWSVRALRRESDGQPETEPWRRVRWWIPILVVCAAGWIVFERIQASASDSAPPGAAGTFATVRASVDGEHRVR